MATGDIDQVGKLLKTLELPKSSRESRMDIHLVLIREITNESSDFMEDLSRSAVLFLKHIKNDMKKDDSALVQSAIHVLGFLLHSPDIVSSFSGSILKGILQDIFTLLQATDDKAICTRALWCLSKQTLPSDIIAKEISHLLSLINLCILGKSFESGSMEIEAINVFQRLLAQCPDKMLTNKDDWFKMVYPFVISNTPKVAERALIFLEQNVSELKVHSVNFSKCLMSDLSEGLTERLRMMFTKKQELFVLRVWSCFITILDKNMHQGSPLTNSLFKVIEQAFKATSLEILDAAYRAWMTLIDNFATSKANILSQKRLKLLLMPLANSTSKSERKLQVEQARFDCWLHLIRILKDDLNEIFDQVVAPFLLFLFTMPQESDTPVNLTMPKTPTNARGTEGSKTGTPKTPASTQFDIASKGPGLLKNLHYGSNVLKKKGAEILYELVTEEIDKDLGDTKETRKFERLSIEKFKNHSVLMMVALQDLTLHCGKDLQESLLSGIWKSFCFYIRKLAAEGSKGDLTISFGGLLLSLQKLVEVNCTSSQVALKIISECYNDLNIVMNQHKDLLKTDTNPQGSFPIHIFQLMFNERFLKDQESLSSERFFKLFETLMVDMMSSVSSQLISCHHVVQTIDTVADHFKDKDTLWCFWNTSVDLLMEYINQNHDVNQGNALEHDFSAILEMLAFPIKNLLDSDLPMSVMKEIDASWTKLFSAFVRESALIPTIDDNQAIEEFCSRLNMMLKHGEIHLKDLKFLGRLIPTLSKVTDKLHFSNVAPDDRTKMTPKSVSKKQENVLSNAKSLIGVLYTILKFVSNLEIRMENKQAEQHLHSTLDVISNYFSKTEGAELIKESVETFSRPLVVLLSSDSKSSGSGKSSGSTKQLQFIAKVLSSTYTCVLERYGKPVDAELLQKMAPLIKTTLAHEKSIVRNRTIEFWNKTFGQIAFLTYPDNLREFLRNVKTSVPLLLPGVERSKSDQAAIAETEDVTQLSENSALPHSPNIRKTTASTLMKSPHKIHGSFLQKARSAEKAMQSPPAKRVIAIHSPKTEPKQKPVRRKLPLPLEKGTDEFVEIAPSPKKRRILTEHQKDVLRAKSDVPALYNQLDPSTQDAFLSDDTQQRKFSQAEIQNKRSRKVSLKPRCTMDFTLNTQSKDAPDIQDTTVDGNLKPTETDSLHAQDKKSETIKQSTRERAKIVSEKDIDVNTKDDGKADVDMNRKDDRKVETRVSPRNRKLEEWKKARNDAKSKAKSSAKKPMLTFKDLLSQVASMDTSIEEDSGSDAERVILSSDSEREPTPVKSKSGTSDKGEVVQSSYTPLGESSPEKPLPFTFSSTSSFAKAAGNTSDKSTAQETGAEKPSKDQGKSDSKEIPDSGRTGDEQNTVESNATSTSPDFIPSSQSQKDPTPLLRGVTLLTPRRSNRQVKKTERVMEAVKSKALPLGRSSVLGTKDPGTGTRKDASEGDVRNETGKSQNSGGVVDEGDVAKKTKKVTRESQKSVSAETDRKESDDSHKPPSTEVPKGDLVKPVNEEPLKRNERNRAKSSAATKVSDTSQDVVDAVEIPDDGMDNAMVMLDVPDANENALSSTSSCSVEEKERDDAAINGESGSEESKGKGKELDPKAVERDFESKQQAGDDEGVVIRDKLEMPTEGKSAGKEISKGVTENKDETDNKAVVTDESKAKLIGIVELEGEENGNQATEGIGEIQKEAKTDDRSDDKQGEKESKRKKNDRRKSTKRRETESISSSKTDVGKEEISVPRVRRSIRVVKKDLAIQTSIGKHTSKEFTELPREGLNSEPLFSTNDDMGSVSGISDTTESSETVKENLDNSKDDDYSSNSNIDSAKEDIGIVKEKTKSGSHVLTPKIDRSMIKESLEILSNKMRSKGKTLSLDYLQKNQLSAKIGQMPDGPLPLSKALGSTVPDSENAGTKISDSYSKSSDAKISDTKFSEAISSDAESPDAKISDNRFSDTASPDVKSSGIIPSDAKNPDTESSNAVSSDAKSLKGKSSDADVMGRSSNKTQDSSSVISDTQISVQILDTQMSNSSTCETALNKDSIQASNSTPYKSDIQASDVMFHITDSDLSGTKTNLRSDQAVGAISDPFDTQSKVDDIAKNLSDENEAQNQSEASSQNDMRDQSEVGTQNETIDQNDARPKSEASSRKESSDEVGQTSTSEESTNPSTAARRSSKRVSVRLSKKAAEAAMATERQIEGDLRDSGELHSDRKDNSTRLVKECLIVTQGDVKGERNVDEEIVVNSENSLQIGMVSEAMPGSVVLSLLEVKEAANNDDRPDEVVPVRRSSPRKSVKKQGNSMDTATPGAVAKELSVHETEVRNSHKKGASRSRKKKEVIIVGDKTSSISTEENENSTDELKTGLIKILLPKAEHVENIVNKSLKLGNVGADSKNPDCTSMVPKQAFTDNSSSSDIKATSSLKLLEAKATSSKKRSSEKGELKSKARRPSKKSTSRSHNRKPGNAVGDQTNTSEESKEVPFEITKECLDEIQSEKEQSANEYDPSDSAETQNIGNGGLKEREVPNKEGVPDDDGCDTSGSIIDDDMRLVEILAVKKRSHKKGPSTAKAYSDPEEHEDSKLNKKEVKDTERRPKNDLDVGTQESGTPGVVPDNRPVTEAKPKKGHKKKEKTLNLKSNSSERFDMKQDVPLKMKEESKKHRSRKKTKAADSKVEVIAKKSSVTIEVITGNEKAVPEHNEDLNSHDNACDVLQIAKEKAGVMTAIEEASTEDSNSILDTRRAASTGNKQKTSVGLPTRRKTARKSIKGKGDLKSEIFANKKELDLNIANQVSNHKDQLCSASEDRQNANAMIDLNSYAEDASDLAAIKRSCEKNEDSRRPDVVIYKANDSSGVSHSKVLASVCELTDGNKESLAEAEPQTSHVSKHTEAKKEPVEMRRSPRKGKRKHQIDLEDIESETIEGIFNSPDNPTENSKKSKSGDVSFEILESDTVETMSTTSQGGELKDKVADMLSHITESPTRTRSPRSLKTDCQTRNRSPRRIVQYRQYPLRQKIESSDVTTTESDDVPEEPIVPDDVKENDVMKDDVVTLDVIKDDVMTSDIMKSNTKKEKKQNVKIAFVLPHMTASSPSARMGKTGSPTVSPISGILKRKLGGKTESPSPPNKNRRVSFAYPLEEKRSIGDPLEFDKSSDLAVPLPFGDANDTNKTNSGTPKKFTTIRKKLSSPKITSQNSGPAVFPDLVECSTPIEKLLPSITTVTWSRGLGNIIRSQNIRTVGNLCALSESQIEGLPIRSPKVQVVKTALRKFRLQQMRSDKQQTKGNVQTDSPTSTLKTPTKEHIEILSDKQAFAGTPSRKSAAKRTSLFIDREKKIANDVQISEEEIAQEIQVTGIFNENVLPAVNILPSAPENDTMETEAVELGATGNNVTNVTVFKQDIDIEKSCLTSEHGELEEEVVAEWTEENVAEIDEVKKERISDATSVVSMITDVSKPDTAQIPSDIVDTVHTEKISADGIAKDIVALEPDTMDDVLMNDISKEVVAKESIDINAIATQPITIEAGRSAVKPEDSRTSETINGQLNTTFESVMEELPELSLKESIAIHKKILDFSQKVLAVIEKKMDDSG